MVFQALAGDHASGQCEIFVDGFAGAVTAPGQAAHRPSGVAVGPDGSLFVSDDVRGRIYRIIYRGGSGATAGAAKFTACPSALAGAGQISADDAKPPEGTHPDAGAAAESANLPVPAGAIHEMVALGERIFLGQVNGATCTGCHGADARAPPWVLTSPTPNGCGAMAASRRSRKRSPPACRSRKNTAPPCPRWAVLSSRPIKCRRSPPTSGP